MENRKPVLVPSPSRKHWLQLIGACSGTFLGGSFLRFNMEGCASESEGPSFSYSRNSIGQEQRQP